MNTEQKLFSYLQKLRADRQQTQQSVLTGHVDEGREAIIFLCKEIDRLREHQHKHKQEDCA